MRELTIDVLLLVAAFLCGRIGGLMTTRKIKERAPKWNGYPGNAGGIPEEIQRTVDPYTLRCAWGVKGCHYSTPYSPTAVDEMVIHLRSVHNSGKCICWGLGHVDCPIHGDDARVQAAEYKRGYRNSLEDRHNYDQKKNQAIRDSEGEK